MSLLKQTEICPKLYGIFMRGIRKAKIMKKNIRNIDEFSLARAELKAVGNHTAPGISLCAFISPARPISSDLLDDGRWCPLWTPIAPSAFTQEVGGYRPRFFLFSKTIECHVARHFYLFAKNQQSINLKKIVVKNWILFFLCFSLLFHLVQCLKGSPKLAELSLATGFAREDKFVFWVEPISSWYQLTCSWSKRGP